MKLYSIFKLDIFYCMLGSCFKEGVDYAGHNIKWFQVKSADNCQSACVAEAGCNAWTFVKSTGRCYLKYTIEKIRYGNANLISGPKWCESKCIIPKLTTVD